MNRLSNESSPYLRQHANNPVDWYPWGPEALERARTEDRPILLSIGYAACHWCHVMAHESFEDAGTAAIMNRDFVNVKVDREERPDLDEIYMSAVQAFTGGHGGWPMTVFLTPDGRPYFGGTYFPPEPRGRMPSFRQVLSHASRLYRERRGDALEMAARVTEALADQAALPNGGPKLEQDWLGPIARAADRDYDEANGGFGRAPKFPPHGTLASLLAHHFRTKDARSLELVTGTLDGMIRGGMYDHVGGGFARYSVDGEWRVPHFEKMLYDNAQLVPVYVDAWKVTGRATYARIARETCDFVLREMTSADGAFWSAYDADSEGEEGKFYVWTPKQLRDVLGLLDGMRVATLLEVTDEGTFEHGTSVLRLERPLEDLDPGDRDLLVRALPRLYDARKQRVPPGLDDKVVVAWNGLMIGALARAGAAFGHHGYVDAACRAATALLDRGRPGGRLVRVLGGRIPGFLDDHACLVDGLVDLYEATFDLRWLREALVLADRTVDLFWDHADAGTGGFFYAGHDAETLIVRSRKPIGGAEPSPGGTAALTFLRLAALCGRDDLGDKAESALKAVQSLLKRAPRALGVEALAGAWRVGPTAEIALVGGRSPEMDETIRVVRRRYLPFAVVGRAEGMAPPELPWTADRPASPDGPTAYVCEGYACKLPAVGAHQLEAQLEELGQPVASPASDVRVRAPELPQQASAWIGSKPLSLADLRGNVVVLDFWAYCCVNCMHVLPELDAIEARFAGQPVAVIGVHAAKFPAEHEAENVARAVERHRIRHPVVNDAEHVLWDQYAVRAWPTVVVVDAEGRVAWEKSGEVSRQELEPVVARLLEEARNKGVIASVPAVVSRERAPTGPLAFPGKVTVVPDVLDQAAGADPFASDARLYVADSGHHRVVEASLARGADGWPVAKVLRIFGDGQPGLADGDATSARFRGPQGLSVSAGTLWVADTENHALRAVDLATGRVTTVAGTGELGRGGAVDPDRPTQTALRSPWDVLATEEVVFVAMAGTHQLWVYLPQQRRIGPFVGSGAEAHVDGAPQEAALAQPSGLALWGRYLFWVDSETSSVRLLDLEQHVAHTVVGQGLFDFGDQDGVGDEVRLQHPLGIAVGDGALWVADTFNGKIKRIELPGGETRTVAVGLSEPGGLATAGELLIVADTGNHRIVAVNRSTGEIRPIPLG